MGTHTNSLTGEGDPNAWTFTLDYMDHDGNHASTGEDQSWNSIIKTDSQATTVNIEKIPTLI